MKAAFIALWVGWGAFMAWMAWQMFVVWPRQERQWKREAQEDRDAINRAFAEERAERQRLDPRNRHSESLRRAWRSDP